MATKDNKKSNATTADNILSSLGISRTVDVSEAHRAINLALDTSVIPFLLSATSQGKSTLITRIAKERGWPVLIMNMVSLEPSDLAGIPFPSHDGQSFMYLKDGRIPIGDDESPLLLFLDEVNRCPNSTVNAVFQLLNGFLGSSRLGKNVKVVLAANPSGAGYQVAAGVTRDPALIARVTFISMQLGMFEALSHMRQHAWHPAVLQTIEQHPSLLFETEVAPGKVAATARGWERTSQLLHAYDKRRDMSLPFDEGEATHLFTLVEGTIGPKAANMLFETLRSIGASYITTADFFTSLVASETGTAGAWLKAALTGESDNNLVVFNRMDALAAYLLAARPPAADVVTVLARLTTLSTAASVDLLLNRLRRGAEDHDAAQGSAGGASARDWLAAIKLGAIRNRTMAASGKDRVSRKAI